MKFSKLLKSIFLLFLLLFSEGKVKAGFDLQTVQLFRDNNICVKGSSGQSSLSLSSLTSNQESVQSNAPLCPAPPIFTGGAILTTTNGIKIQANPTVQTFGRGILISETPGSSGGVSSSGDSSAFSSLTTRLGGLATSIFEIRLPSGCDVIDDDDDILGASTDLTSINDFSFPTCASTNGFSVECNVASGLLTAINGLVPASGSERAKIRFVISSVNSSTDSNMIDSILIKLDSQDIFCSSTTTGTLTADIIAKNAVDNPTKSETIGSVDIGIPIQAAKISYSKDTATSLKGEVSTNEVSNTPILTSGSIATANTIQIEELHNESLPIGGQISPLLINPSLTTNTAEVTVIHLWIIPSVTNLFSGAPSSTDITFSDNSIALNSAPFIVKTNGDDINAPFGTLIIPLKKNQGGTDPLSVKTTIKIDNLLLNKDISSAKDLTVSLSFYEPISGGIVNTPGGLSIVNSPNLTNPQNFSSYSANSTRALAQNAIISTAVNDGTGASQIVTDADLSALTNRNTTLGTPQITGFAKVISSLTPIDLNKVTISNSNSTLTVTGEEGASIPGAKVKIESVFGGSMTVFDSVTITSKSNGAFTAKTKANFLQGDVPVNLKQTVSGTESTIVSKTISKGITVGSELNCEQTVCGCENTNCIPSITNVLGFIQNNGGLSTVVSSGGAILEELINSAKKALGLS